MNSGLSTALFHEVGKNFFAVLAGPLARLYVDALDTPRRAGWLQEDARTDWPKLIFCDVTGTRLLVRVTPRKSKRLYDHRDAILEVVRAKYLATGTVTKVTTSRKIAKRASSVGMKK